MAQVVNLTFTSPVNKPGQQPVLSANDVWKGLEYITRRPEDIVDYLAGCEILSDNGLNLKRRLLFKEGTDMPDKPIEQDVTLCPKMKVEYVGSTGTSTLMVTNGEGDDEVYLSQVLQDPYRPGVSPGTTEAVEFENHLATMAKSNISSSIDSLRKLKANGQL